MQPNLESQTLCAATLLLSGVQGRRAGPILRSRRSCASDSRLCYTYASYTVLVLLPATHTHGAIVTFLQLALAGPASCLRQRRCRKLLQLLETDRVLRISPFKQPLATHSHPTIARPTRASLWVASRRIFGTMASPYRSRASKASFHRPAQRHHLHPPLSPGKTLFWPPEPPNMVALSRSSLPRSALNFRNSSLTIAATGSKQGGQNLKRNFDACVEDSLPVWSPWSSREESQKPVLRKPETGSVEHLPAAGPCVSAVCTKQSRPKGCVVDRLRPEARRRGLHAREGCTAWVSRSLAPSCALAPTIDAGCDVVCDAVLHCVVFSACVSASVVRCDAMRCCVCAEGCVTVVWCGEAPCPACGLRDDISKQGLCLDRRAAKATWPTAHRPAGNASFLCSITIKYNTHTVLII